MGFHRGRTRRSPGRWRPLARTAVLIAVLAAGWLAGAARPATAASSLNTPAWSASGTAAGASAVSYTYSFKTTGGTGTLSSVTMTVPAGTGGSPAVGTVTPPSLAAGGTVSLSGTTLTYSFTPATVKSGTPVSIQLKGLTNTATAGTYTSAITTFNGGSAVQTGTTPAVTFTSGVLVNPGWTASTTTTAVTGASYTYTFTTSTAAQLGSVTMTVPSGTAGTPAVGSVTPAAMAAGGAVALSGTTLTYSFTPATIAAGTAVSIQVKGLTNTSFSGVYTAEIVTVTSTGAAIDSGTTPALTFAAGTLGSPAWSSSSTSTSVAASYTYTFTTATTSTLSSVTMTVPAGTAGSPAAGTVSPAALTAGAAVALSGTTLTYSFTATTVNAGTAVSIQITGLTNTPAAGSYTAALTTDSDTGIVDSGTTPAVTFTGALTLTSPSSLTWAITLNGANQSAADTTAADQQLTVADSTGSGAGWHITVSATTLTSGTHALANTGTLVYTGSISSAAATTAPDAACVSTCTLPADTTTYPVAITTAGSSPPPVTIYDTPAGTGLGQITLGGPGASHPGGWWVNVPASAYAGAYSTTVTLAVVSAP